MRSWAAAACCKLVAPTLSCGTFSARQAAAELAFGAAVTAACTFVATERIFLFLNAHLADFPDSWLVLCVIVVVLPGFSPIFFEFCWRQQPLVLPVVCLFGHGCIIKMQFVVLSQGPDHFPCFLAWNERLRRVVVHSYLVMGHVVLGHYCSHCFGWCHGQVLYLGKARKTKEIYYRLKSTF
jgi:hypothetical protein